MFQFVTLHDQVHDIALHFHVLEFLKLFEYRAFDPNYAQNNMVTNNEIFLSQADTCSHVL